MFQISAPLNKRNLDLTKRRLATIVYRRSVVGLRTATSKVERLVPTARPVFTRLGHASIVLTLDAHSHVLPAMQKVATAKIENILFRHYRHTTKKGAATLLPLTT